MIVQVPIRVQEIIECVTVGFLKRTVVRGASAVDSVDMRVQPLAKWGWSLNFSARFMKNIFEWKKIRL